MKYIQVLVKVPSKWVDFESPLGLIQSIIKGKLNNLLEEKVVEKVLKEMKMPKIKITKEEVKSRMLDILAERALEEQKCCKEE